MPDVVFVFDVRGVHAAVAGSKGKNAVHVAAQFATRCLALAAWHIQAAGWTSVRWG